MGVPVQGTVVVDSGGVASSTNVGPLGELDVFGTAIDTTVSGSGNGLDSPVEVSELIVESGGVASNTSAGRLSEVDVFGTAIGTTLSGTTTGLGPQLSELVVESGGFAS